MKIVWLSALIFCATLVLVAANLDLGPIIKIAQCRSMCLRQHMINGICKEWNTKNKSDLNHCEKCWDTCEILGREKEERHKICVSRRYGNANFIQSIMPLLIPLNSSTHNIPHECQGCETACKFFGTRRMEEEKYEPTKLPAPEIENIHMYDYDVAVIMKKNFDGIWEEEDYRYAFQQPTILKVPIGGWVIVVTNDSVVRHHSWEKWTPKLQSLKNVGPLYQANITWQDWRTQLKNQRESITSDYFRFIFKRLTMKEEQYKLSFVVTWQEETGNGIMGNQVTDSESAQISLPCGKYLVRVAINDGPGSYSIIIDTEVCEKTHPPKTSIRNTTTSLINLVKQIVKAKLVQYLSLGIFCFITYFYLYLFHKNQMKKRKERIEKKRLTEAEKKLMKEKNLTKIDGSRSAEIA